MISRQTYFQAYRLKNRVRILSAHRERYLKNRDKVLLAQRERYKRRRLTTPELVREKGRRDSNTFRKKNPERAREIGRKSREKNREGINKRFRIKYQSTPLTRLAFSLRDRIVKALRGRSKSARTFELVGCTPLELWAHLKAKFVPGMTQENYGPVWHVDHIRPCASFDLADIAQQRECFHYTNLQPLFARDNFSKGSKWPIPSST